MDTASAIECRRILFWISARCASLSPATSASVFRAALASASARRAPLVIISSSFSPSAPSPSHPLSLTPISPSVLPLAGSGSAHSAPSSLARCLSFCMSCSMISSLSRICPGRPAHDCQQSAYGNTKARIRGNTKARIRSHGAESIRRGCERAPSAAGLPCWHLSPPSE